MATTVIERQVCAAHRSLLDCKFTPAPAGPGAANECAGEGVARANEPPTIAEQSRSFGLNAEQHAVFVVWAAAVLDRKLRAVDGSSLSDSCGLELVAAQNAASVILGGVQQVFGFCAGEGGCGKSYVLKCLVDFAEKHGAGPYVRVLAFTGSAAASIGSLCATIHTGLSIGLHATVRTLQATRREERERWNEVGVLFLEEISMVAADDLGRCDVRLRALRGDDRPFGGLHVFYLGDLYQITMGKQAFSVGSSSATTAAGSSSTDTQILIDRGHAAWALINHFSELLVNERFDDPEFMEVMKRLRVGAERDGDVAYLSQRFVMQGTALPPGLVYATPTNLVRMNVNHLAFCASLANAATGLHQESTSSQVLAAFHSSGHLRVLMSVSGSTSELSAGTAAEVRQLGDDKFGGKTGVLEIRLGGCGSLVGDNVAPHLGLSNGAQVIFDQVVLEPGARLFLSQTENGLYVPTCEATSVAAVVVRHAAGPHAAADSYGLGTGRFPVLRKGSSHRITFHGTQAQVKVSQIPLVPSVCSTGHKLQGRTVPGPRNYWNCRL